MVGLRYSTERALYWKGTVEYIYNRGDNHLQQLSDKHKQTPNCRVYYNQVLEEQVLKVHCYVTVNKKERQLRKPKDWVGDGGELSKEDV